MKYLLVTSMFVSACLIAEEAPQVTADFEVSTPPTQIKSDMLDNLSPISSNLEPAPTLAETETVLLSQLSEVDQEESSKDMSGDILKEDNGERGGLLFNLSMIDIDADTIAEENDDNQDEDEENKEIDEEKDKEN